MDCHTPGFSGERNVNQHLSKKEKRRLLLWAGLALAAVTVLTVAVGVPLVRFASEPERFRTWVEDRGIWGPIAYMAMVIVQIIIAIIPGEPFEIAAGYAFGAFRGTMLYLAAATAGSLLVFLLVRRYGVGLVEMVFTRERLQSVRFLKSTPRRDLLFLIVFMLPGTPKDLLCWFAGLTDMRLGVWLVICSLGRIPAAVASTVGGDALGSGSYVLAAIAFAVSLAISAGGLLIYGWIQKRRNKAS